MRREDYPYAVFAFCTFVLLALIVGVVLVGCAGVSPETITVQVPVARPLTPPPELTAPLTAPLPVFVAPTTPAATSALTPAGERDLQQLLLELFTRLRAWTAWAQPEVSP
jgi:hypothetical protein